jgi:hypothetical protein
MEPGALSSLTTLDVTPNNYVYSTINVNKSHNRPGFAQRVPGGLGSKIFTIFGT